MSDTPAPDGDPSPCDDLRAGWVEHADGRLDAETAARVDAHLAACPACARDYAAQREVVARLRARPTPAIPGLWEAIDARLSAPAAQPAPAPAPAVAPPRRPFLALRLSRRTAAAAVVLLAAGLVFYASLTPPTTPHLAAIEGPGVPQNSAKEPIHPPNQPPRDLRVSLWWPEGAAPPPGARIEIVRRGRIIARGKITGRPERGTTPANVHLEPGEELEVWDEVRMGE